MSVEARFFGGTKKATGKRRQMASRLLLVFLDSKKAVGAETNRAGNLRKSWSFVYQGAVRASAVAELQAIFLNLINSTCFQSSCFA